MAAVLLVVCLCDYRIALCPTLVNKRIEEKKEKILPE